MKLTVEELKMLIGFIGGHPKVKISQELSDLFKKMTKEFNFGVTQDQRNKQRYQKIVTRPGHPKERGMNWEEPDWEWINDVARGR
jgi:hypothetical protein|tara:strand:+ start:947 stop:1201 length:255 start_codon:yes stop_codon:yes gene_type:complete